MQCSRCSHGQHAACCSLCCKSGEKNGMRGCQVMVPGPVPGKVAGRGGESPASTAADPLNSATGPNEIQHANALICLTSR